MKEEVKSLPQSSQLIELPHHADGFGNLIVLEGGQLVSFYMKKDT